MIKRTALVLALCLAVGFARTAAADSAAGATAFDFLNFDANARPVALAGAYTALATDSNALLYNPAGLGMETASEASFMHNQYVQGITQEYVSYASKAGWGLNANYLNWGGIPRTTLSQPGGTGTNVGLNDLALGGGFGHSFGALSLGAGVKVLREQIDNVTGTGFALDAGALYAVGQVPGLTLGVAVRNFGPDVKYQLAKEKLPAEARVGAAFSGAAFGAMHTLAFDVSKDRLDKMRAGVGLESVLGKTIAVRFGYTTRNDAGIGVTGGVGWLWQSASIDYAIVPFDTLGIAHRVSLSYRWGSASAQ